jgi:integrase
MIRVTERKTIQDIERIPEPQELYQQLINGVGYPYKNNMDFYLARDRALVSILYLGALRISEALPLTLQQFKYESNRIRIESILLAKRKPGKVKYREAWLPLKGPRAAFTELITNYIEALKKEDPNADRLFPWSLKKVQYPIRGPKGLYQNKKGEKVQRYSVRLVGTNRAWQVVKALLIDPNAEPEKKGWITAHWLRQFGDDYLYDSWDHDLMAVSDYTKQDARTLQLYLRKRYQKYRSA